LVAVSLTGCLDRGGLDPTDDGGGPPDGGKATGGKTGTGGAPGTGGIQASGGAPGTGGVPGSGGIVGTGGVSATGGKTGTGGSPGSGGGGAAHGTGGIGGTGGTGGQRMCGPVCLIFCQYGNVTDASGCPTCGCKPPPVCAGIACPVACQFGYVKDPTTGCNTCACSPDPNTCASTDCGAAPIEPVTLVCSVPPGPGPGAPAFAAAGPAGATAPLIAIPALPYVCQRGADGKCAWQKGGCRVCAPVLCKIACPNGFKNGADGCPACACNPPPQIPACATYADYNTCQADALCTWLKPGCGQPALAAAGCYARTSLGCASDMDCGQGRQCLKRFVSTCPPGAICPPVCEVQTICQ
jgi:Antistasin family